MWSGFSRIALYISILMIPLTLVAVLRPETDHGFVYELGKNFALLGFTIIALQFLLSARFESIERPFGQDMLLHFHKWMAVFATSLLLIHPLLLAAGDKGWPLLIALDVPWYIWAGKTGLLMLLVHVVLSIFRQSLGLGFERWRFVHNILALSIVILGFLHSWNAGGDLTLISMRTLWAGMLSVSVLTFIYHRVLRPFGQRLHPCRVSEVQQETHNVWTIQFVPPEGRKWRAYLPGQFHFITLYRGRGLPVEEHPFSISSSPTEEGFITSTVKESGDFTASIGQTSPGDQVGIHGSFGRFSYVLHSEERDLVFIAGGIGITPLMSMLRHMRDTRSERRVLLLYANKTQKDIVFGDELAAMEAAGLFDLKVVHILSQGDDSWSGETGHLDCEKIERLCGNIMGRAFYVCGPAAMMEKVIKDLRSLGVADAQIHFERFSF